MQASTSSAGSRNDAPVALAQIPGGTLDPKDVTKFVTPAAHPAGDAGAGTIRRPGGKPVDYYEISMRQFAQQILPAGLPATTVWGYGAVSGAEQPWPAAPQRPVAHDRGQWNRPVRVKWINDLVDANGDYLPHLLPVDPTLHWANPPGGMAGRDTRPTFEGRRRAATPARCRWSPTSTVRSASVTRATAMRRPGTCRPPGTSRPAMRPKGRGTTSSRARRRRATARPGGRASPRSSTRTPTAPRPSGTTTTPSG